MTKIQTVLYRISCNFIHYLSLIFIGLLFATTFFFTSCAENMDTQKALISIDNPIFNLFGCLLFFAILFSCCRVIFKRAAKCKRILLLMVPAWIMFTGVVMLLFSRSAPSGDAWSVYDCAERMATGDYSVIHPTDSYLSYYPQQIGLLAFLELLIRILKPFPLSFEYYHYIKLCYAALTCVIVYFQYKIVHLLWEDDRADCIYLILAGCNFPLIMYSSFIYSEIPSFAALTTGIYYLLCILTQKQKRTLPCTAVSLVALAISVMLRKNSLVILIAVVIVMLLEWCSQRRKLLLIYAVLCTTLSLSILPAVQKVYEFRAGNFLRSGVPAMTYFAMGMQEASKGYGWYNGFNFCTYQDTGMDRAASVAVSRRAISERLSYFCENPGYAGKFYLGKYLSQWADGTYACRQATLATFGGRNAFFEELYDGKYSKPYVSYCNLYQLAIFMCIFFFFLNHHLSGRRFSLYLYLPLIGAFGGFLFHMLWEANSRYIFLYWLLLLPYSAKGALELYDTLRRLLSSLFLKRSKAKKEMPSSADTDI
ncbi:MAG: hypothetical protein ACI4HQ_04380 [Acetatifactor sp.]